jgi:enediyne biosynthesis protein E4
MERPTPYLILLVLLIFVTGCVNKNELEVTVQQSPLQPRLACSGRFVAHDLPHQTAIAVERVGFFVSNGSGLAVNDLDNDGDLDIILGNIFGPNHIFWNEGNWQFRAEVLFEESIQAVTTVDVDADGWLDIVLTTRGGNVQYWQNQGATQPGQFQQIRLKGVEGYAYTLDWGDLDGDQDLDLVMASYDASMEKIHGSNFRTSNLAGVHLSENRGGEFLSTRLVPEAQALTLQITDLNEDGRADILIGNDFDVPDYVWLATDQGWQETNLFPTTTMSTMSFAAGDINNDGHEELFAADMHPYSTAPEIMNQWQPVMDKMTHEMVEGDPQQMANVLQSRQEDGHYLNIAAQSRVEASGWSWSSKFGDLDQDGFLDLYIVNGMQALDNFSHLPNDELVEENQAYRNDSRGNYVRMPSWGLNSLYGGRSMSMADLDGDGDLDIVVNNLQDPSQIFENQLCHGASLLVDLRWPGSPNTHAIGAKLTLQTSAGAYMRQVKVTSGYLSGDPSQVHFGFPPEAQMQALKITWPDRQVTTIDNLQANTLVRVERE